MKRALLWASIIFAASSATGLYFASQAAYAWPQELRTPWRTAVPKHLVYYWMWGALVPVIALLAERFPFAAGRRMLDAAVHVVASCVLAAVEIVSAALVLNWIGIYDGPSTLHFVSVRISNNFHSSLPTYWLILFVLLTLDYHTKYRNREVRALRLERQLAEARLDALRSQLNPHFLFNSLNSISSVMYTDLDAADTMIGKLGELLRMSLLCNRGHEMTLRDELGFVQRYVDIERVRFEQRLDVRYQVEDAALEALVPTLILQPLVENALRYAIAPRAAGGRITISARRDGEWLRLSVADDGEGGPEAPVVEGIGLANTRARLEELYGSGHDLRLITGRGWHVELMIPCRAAPADAGPVHAAAVAASTS